APADDARCATLRLISHEQEDHQHDDQDEPERWGLGRRPGRPRRGRTGQLDASRRRDARGERAHAAPDALVHAAGAERGYDLAVLDLADEPVGEDALEPVADEHAEPPVARCDEEDDARVLALAP